MNPTLGSLVSAIVMGGTVLGLLAAGEVNTRMKTGPEPSWRTIAREKAMNAVSYTFVDSGPSDLSPYLPWIGGTRTGNVARFPEDLGRVQPPPLPTDFHDVEADLALAEAAIRPWTRDLDSPAVRAAQIAADLRRENAASPASVAGRPESARIAATGARTLPVLTQPVKFVEPAPLEIPAPVYEGVRAPGDSQSS
jgi:hypothetical protein